MMNAQVFIPTPFGAVVISMLDNQLHTDLLAYRPALPTETSHPLLSLVRTHILHYLQQPTVSFGLPLHQSGTPFQQRVWQAISAIPAGHSLSYSALAVQLGSGARAVANACGANNLPLLIPCHRVVAKNGLGGFMQGKTDGLRIKAWLLRHEGVMLEDKKHA